MQNKASQEFFERMLGVPPPMYNVRIRIPPFVEWRDNFLNKYFAWLFISLSQEISFCDLLPLITSL